MGPPTERCCDVHESQWDSSPTHMVRKDPSHVLHPCQRPAASSPPGLAPSPWRRSSAPSRSAPVDSPRAAPRRRPARRPRRPRRLQPPPSLRPPLRPPSRSGSRPSSSSTPSTTRTRASPSMTRPGGSSPPAAATPVTGCRSAGTRPGSTRSIRRPIQVTWVGFPGEEHVVLTIDADGGAPSWSSIRRPRTRTPTRSARTGCWSSPSTAPSTPAEVEVAFPSVEAVLLIRIDRPFSQGPARERLGLRCAPNCGGTP